MRAARRATTPGILIIPQARNAAASGIGKLANGILRNQGVGVEQFIRNFVREPTGAWRCIAQAGIQLPGRIEVVPGSVFMKGTRFMNIDLAALLDEQREKERR